MVATSYSCGATAAALFESDESTELSDEVDAVDPYGDSDGVRTVEEDEEEDEVGDVDSDVAGGWRYTPHENSTCEETVCWEHEAAIGDMAVSDDIRRAQPQQCAVREK